MSEEHTHLSGLEIAFMAICTIAAIAIGVGVYVGYNQHQQIKREARLIQEQRYEAVYRSCLEQNKRNDNTIGALKSIIATIVKAHPDQKAQLETALKQNELLINALAPKQACREVALKAVTKPPEPVPNLPPLH